MIMAITGDIFGNIGIHQIAFAIAHSGETMRQIGLAEAHSFATVREGEGYLMNADIPEYVAGNRHNHKATQPRKLLLHKRELNKLMAAVQRDGMTIVPLKLYFNEHGRAKLLLGLARGRKKGDKRDVEKKRDWQRQKARLMKDG